MKVEVEQDVCIGCGTCEMMCGQCFQIEDSKAQVINDDCENVECNMQDVVDGCPVEAIKITK